MASNDDTDTPQGMVRIPNAWVAISDDFTPYPGKLILSYRACIERLIALSVNLHQRLSLMEAWANEEDEMEHTMLDELADAADQDAMCSFLVSDGSSSGN